jgi:hypothetical protein
MKNARSVHRVSQTAINARMSALALAMLLGSSGCLGGSRFQKRVEHSPANLGTAVLVTDNTSFGGADAWVYANDPKKGADPVLLGGSYASDGSLKMQHAVWSRDGSVLAVQARVGESSGRGFKGTFATRYVAAYDYRQHQLLGEAEPTAELSARVSKLLDLRGGKGQIVFSTPYDASGKPMSTREARLYRR